MSTLGLRRRRGRKAGRHKVSRPSELGKQLPPIVSSATSVGSKQSATLVPTADVEAVISTITSTITTTPTTTPVCLVIVFHSAV